VRLVGLYHSARGAHTFFLRAKEVQRPGSYLVNLIHYEDAASLAVAVLAGDGAGAGGHRAATFLGCDGSPVTFADMMDATVRSGRFEGEVTFLGEDEPQTGKRADNAWTRAQLGGWEPKYPSFSSFMVDGKGVDVYVEDAGLASLGLKHGEGSVPKSHKS